MSLSPYQRAISIGASKWFNLARPKQLVDESLSFSVCLWLAGRGFGKSLSLYNHCWINAATTVGDYLLVAPTFGSLDKITLNGDTGFKKIVPLEVLKGGTWKTALNQTTMVLKFENGSQIYLMSSETPENFRGLNIRAAYYDELAAFRYAQEVWDMVQFGLRKDEDIRSYIATTPRPIPLIRMLAKDSDTLLIRGSSYENTALSKKYFERLANKYGGTRLGRQEIEAEILEDIEGALWTWAMIERTRFDVSKAPKMQRIVVSVDPSGGGKDRQGIIVAGIGEDGLYYIIDDCSCALSPEGWARVAVDSYHKYGADLIIAEKNFGGDMVKATIRAIDENVPYKEVHASRGKHIRAEPISALYEQGKVKHFEVFERLELQMTEMTGNGFQGTGSPDELDASVWALTELSNSVNIDLENLIRNF